MPYIHLDMRVLSHVQRSLQQGHAACPSFSIKRYHYYYYHHHCSISSNASIIFTHLQASAPLLSSSFRPSARQHVPLSPLFHHPSHFTCALGTTDALELALFACPQSPWCIIRSLLSAIINHHQSTTTGTATATVHTLRLHHYQRPERPSLHTIQPAAPSCPARRYRATVRSAICQICTYVSMPSATPLHCLPDDDSDIHIVHTYAQSIGPYISSIHQRHHPCPFLQHATCIQTRPRITSLIRRVDNNCLPPTKNLHDSRRRLVTLAIAAGLVRPVLSRC